MNLCILCNKTKDNYHFLKNKDICNTCYRKSLKQIKSCNKCKLRISTTKFTINKKICDDCCYKEELEKKSNVKKCIKCNDEKDIKRFNKNICYDCLNKIRYKRILDGVSKKYPTSKEKRQEWIKRNKEHLKNYRRNYNNDKYKNDINYKLLVICRSFIRICLYTKNGRRTYEILGYSVDQFKNKIECQFKNGMNWKNYGSYWNIDHRKPISSFKKGTDIRIINMLCNLKPVLKEFNFSKQNRFIS